ncbi:DUF397 domain-containing protein [Actinocorallia aurantiaca]|uniref:DUF397 domain-containing protein n=1 Tax=Actinocorallia aurantiaca TaxID=46204 RepID=A0ABN3UTN4_9ACTN
MSRTLDSSDLQWRKSSHSNNGGECVETAVQGHTHLARDSKHPDGSVLTFTRPEWQAFLQHVKTGTHQELFHK